MGLYHDYITIYIPFVLVYKYLYSYGRDTLEMLLESIRWIHVVAGFTGLVAFWVPVFTRKGGHYHRLFGKIFKYSAYLVLGGAGLAVSLHLGLALAEGIGPRQEPGKFAFLIFLGYLTIVTYIGLRHGLLVLQQKPDLSRLNRPWDNVLAWLAIGSSLGLIAYALYFNPPVKIVLFALSPIGFGIGFGVRKAIHGHRPEKKAWFYEHMGAMLGTGVAFHTAFAVFGAARLFSLGLTGWVAIIPWITPALIGIPASIIWTRYYQRKFSDLPA